MILPERAAAAAAAGDATAAHAACNPRGEASGGRGYPPPGASCGLMLERPLSSATLGGCADTALARARRRARRDHGLQEGPRRAAAGR